MRPTLDDIFAEDDEFQLLEVKPTAKPTASSARDIAALQDVSAFYHAHGRLPQSEALDFDEMRLGAIWASISASPSDALIAADTLGLFTPVAEAKDWREAPSPEDIPDSLDDIFSDESLNVDASLFMMRHSTPSAARHQPDHRAEFQPCTDFEAFRARFEATQAALDAGERKATAVKKWAVIEPIEGDFFIRNGLLALIAEKSEMTTRGGSRDHRLRVIFSNGTESDPLMSSFRKSLNDDKTARMVQKIGFGPLDPEWEADRLELSGTIYVARSLSTDPAIRSQREILHKIGVTSQDVRRRIADARNDPTFLLAPVEIVATYDLKNLSRHKVEHLLHRFFASAKPKELFVTDRFGVKTHPKEWFYVLPEHVGQAAKLIQDGTLHLYHYDALSQKIMLNDAKTGESNGAA